MNPVRAMQQAVKSDNIIFLEVSKNACRRKAAESRNAGFRNWWLSKAADFERRLAEVQSDKVQDASS